EGIQDYEKCRILKEEFIQKGEKAKWNKLNELISQFTVEELVRQGADKMVQHARKELNTY
ncbi:hypothetical protein EZS27_043130, partial [termite gut metagenome]